jgi:hypothetical protein
VPLLLRRPSGTLGEAAALRTIQQRQPAKDARAVRKGGLSNQSGDRPAPRHTRGTGTPTARTCSHTNAGLSASHAERGLVRRCQAARPRGPAAPAARPGRAAVAGCLQAGQSAATSKRTGLSLSWRSSHQRPYPSRCWKGRQPGISALRPDCCINVEFRKSTELVAGAPAPRCRSARRTSSSTRMRAACWGTQWPASSKRTGRVARHQSDSQRS